MKRRVSQEELCDFYRTDSIREIAEGYEYTDEETGLIYELPLEYQVFINGGLIDPIRLLTVPNCSWNLVFNEQFAPLEAKYLCVYCDVAEDWHGEVRVAAVNPLDGLKRMNAVLVKAHWDMREFVSDAGWQDKMHALYGEKIIWFLRKAEVNDGYWSSGDWYWLISGATFGITCLFAQYMRTLSSVYGFADVGMADFEKNKADFREQIINHLKKLPLRIHWIVAAEEEELWPKYDASRELWERNLYDLQVIEFDDRLEVKSRNGSPASIWVDILRFDAVGLKICKEKYSE